MPFFKCLLNVTRRGAEITNRGRAFVCVLSPIDGPVCVQQLEDGLAVHFSRDVDTGHIQQRRCQVDVEHDVRVSAGKKGASDAFSVGRENVSKIWWMLAMEALPNVVEPHHSHGALFHVRASHVEWNTDVKLVRHGLALDQAELADVVAMV